ncbi:MAG TPA: ABC transporter substrate-binding protein [Candidatus Binatia bacterium]|jgi:NitT/TauT family transport system substrate-binding protein|nr:ABC transporter substrate-binding protein [Candidatus Binatia bacterium]
MKITRVWLAAILLNLVPLGARVAPIFAAEKLVGLQSAPSIAMALPWFAEEARLYPKYDLDFQLVYIASSGIVTAAMSGGNGAVALVGGEGPIRAFIGGNTDFVFVGSVKNVLTHSIMGRPDIKKPEDLKGKKIGVGRIGGNSHYFAVYGMRQKGLDLQRDTNYIQTGGAPETFLALTSGAVDAASMTTPQDTRAAFAGYNYVIDGRELKPPYVATGFVTLRSVIAKRPKVISQFMHAMAESLKLMVTDRELAYRLMAKKINLTDRKVFDAAYTQELKVLEPKLDIKAGAIQATLDEIARTDPRATKVSPQQLIDRRFLEEMEKDGTFEKLGMK